MLLRDFARRRHLKKRDRHYAYPFEFSVRCVEDTARAMSCRTYSRSRAPHNINHITYYSGLIICPIHDTISSRIAR